MNSPVAQLLAQARLRELAGFLALPAEQLSHAMALAGADPLKVQAAVNLMMADPGADPVPLPRSWSKSDQSVWDALPPAIQLRVSDREYSRDRVVRLKQDEATKLRHEVERLQALLAPAPEATPNGAEKKESQTNGQECQQRSA
jgi:hypothetical protein